jgi:hypothetical protein
VFKLLSHKENANQRYIRILSHPSQIGHHQEDKQGTNAGEDAGGKELLGECKRVNHYGNQYGVSSKN